MLIKRLCFNKCVGLATSHSAVSPFAVNAIRNARNAVDGPSNMVSGVSNVVDGPAQKKSTHMVHFVDRCLVWLCMALIHRQKKRK